MLTRDYDYNIYCPSETELTVSAYEMIRSKDTGEFVDTDTSKYHTLTIEMTEANHELVSYLLDSEDWYENQNEDFDKWCGEDYLREGTPPKELVAWLESLPSYEPRTA